MQYIIPFVSTFTWSILVFHASIDGFLKKWAWSYSAMGVIMKNFLGLEAPRTPRYSTLGLVSQSTLCLESALAGGIKVFYYIPWGKENIGRRILNLKHAYALWQDKPVSL